MFARLFSRRQALADRAWALYQEVQGGARAPALYIDYATPDTIDGRFEAVMFYAHLVFRRLRRADGDAQLGQAMFDRMFVDFEHALREIGVGDDGVVYKIKHMGKSAFGRFAAYDDGLEGGAAAQIEALTRNYFGTVDAPSVDALSRLAALQRDVDARLATMDVRAIERARPLFGELME